MFNTSHWLTLHIKLGVTKNFVKAVDQDSNSFKFFKGLFEADESDAKLKAEVFVGAEITVES